MANAVFFGFTLFGLLALVFSFRIPEEPGMRPAAFIVGWGFILLGWYVRRLLRQQERRAGGIEKQQNAED